MLLCFFFFLCFAFCPAKMSRKMCKAKASFSAYVLVKCLLKIGEKVHFSTKKSTTNSGLPFCFFPFPFFASKWLKYAVFAFQKPKRRQKTRPPPCVNLRRIVLIRAKRVFVRYPPLYPVMRVTEQLVARATIPDSLCNLAKVKSGHGKNHENSDTWREFPLELSVALRILSGCF